MRRVLAVDWGERRLGLALSDPLGLTAQPLPPLVLPSSSPAPAAPAAPRAPATAAAPAAPAAPRPPDEAALRALSALVENKDVERIVLGLPLLLSGEKGEAARAVEAFAAGLRARVRVPVELWDERFTSALAEQSLREEGVQAGRRRGGGRARARAPRATDRARIDQRAAQLLLQSWLDAHPERP